VAPSVLATPPLTANFSVHVTIDTPPAVITQGASNWTNVPLPLAAMAELAKIEWEILLACVTTVSQEKLVALAIFGFVGLACSTKLTTRQCVWNVKEDMHWTIIYVVSFITLFEL